MIKKNRLKDGIKVVDDMFNDESREKIIKAMKDIGPLSYSFVKYQSEKIGLTGWIESLDPKIINKFADAHDNIDKENTVSDVLSERDGADLYSVTMLILTKGGSKEKPPKDTFSLEEVDQSMLKIMTMCLMYSLVIDIYKQTGASDVFIFEDCRENPWSLNKGTISLERHKVGK